MRARTLKNDELGRKGGVNEKCGIVYHGVQHLHYSTCNATRRALAGTGLVRKADVYWKNYPSN